MNAISNNSVISNFQISNNGNHIHRNMSHGQVSHDMSKMNEVGSKEQMKADCNMKEMHQNTAASSSVEFDSSIKAVDSNLGRNIDIQV